MPELHAFRRAVVLMVAAGSTLITVVGCVSSPEPTEMARTTLQTAPADLQLLCASAAATSFGVESSKILPVSSSQLNEQTYQVELDAGGSRATCVVDAAGNVQSVKKV